MKREKESKSDIREDLVKYITDHPGVSFPAIQKAFKINVGTLRYHLDYLVSDDRIRRVKDGHRNYCPSEMTGSSKLRMDGLSRDQKRIVHLIKDHPGISLSELRSVSGKDRDDLRYILKKITEHRYVWKIEDGRNPRYEYIIEKELALEMISVLLEKLLEGEISRENFLSMKKKIEEEFGQITQ
jgi:predicted transcriptional regulator